jgi:predicted nucleic acid-binding protein
MYLVDTNVFLEVLLSGSRKDECKRFLDHIRNGRKKGVVTDFSIHSILVIMEGFGKRRALKVFLRSLLSYEGLSVYPTTLLDEVDAIDLSYETNLDLDDAIQYRVASALKVQGIVSFDKHFDGLEISRVEPIQILQG